MPTPRTGAEAATAAVRLPDGTPVRLRPIRPDDEPRWLSLLAACSAESVYARFQYFFPWRSPGMAARFCAADGRREIAWVAEPLPEGEPGLLGVGRLVLGRLRGSAEYALLVRDDWQRRGVGGALTRRCLDVAAERGLNRVVSRTTAANGGMLALLRRHGFALARSADGIWVEGIWSGGKERC